MKHSVTIRSLTDGSEAAHHFTSRMQANAYAGACAGHPELEVVEPTAEEIWAERDRRVASLNERTDAHRKGDHSKCHEDCDTVWYAKA